MRRNCKYMLIYALLAANFSYANEILGLFLSQQREVCWTSWSGHLDMDITVKAPKMATNMKGTYLKSIPLCSLCRAKQQRVFRMCIRCGNKTHFHVQMRSHVYFVESVLIKRQKRSDFVASWWQMLLLLAFRKRDVSMSEIRFYWTLLSVGTNQIKCA